MRVFFTSFILLISTTVFSQNFTERAIEESQEDSARAIVWKVIEKIPFNLGGMIVNINNVDCQFKPTDIIFGGRVCGDSSKVYFKYDGLMLIVPNYSFVDGFRIGQSMELGIKRNENSLWKITPTAYWTTARKTLVWDVDVSLTYAPSRLGKVSLHTGSRTEDYNYLNGTKPIGNALYSLFLGVNNSHFFENNFLKINNEIDIADGLNLMLGLTFAKRNPLQNYTTFSFFGNPEDAEPNIPIGEENLNARFTGLNRYSIKLKYTPEYYPSFSLSYNQGISGLMAHSSNFSRLEATVSQNISLRTSDRLMYEVIGGGFLNENSFNYIDYKHFNSASGLFITKTFEATYALLDHYKHSTHGHWMQAFVTYQTQCLLLKRLSSLQRKTFYEALHARFLYTPDKPYYNEWGYSIGIPMLGAVGVFSSFDSLKHAGWGVSISLEFLQLFGLD